MRKSINRFGIINGAHAACAAIAFLAIATLCCDKLQSDDQPAAGTPSSIPENNNQIALSKIGPDDFWIYYRKTFSEKDGTPFHLIPLTGITPDSTLEVVVGDEFKKYTSPCVPGSGYEKEILALSDSRTAIPQHGHKAVIYGIVGFDELRVPIMKPRFLVAAGKDNIGIYDVNLPVKTFRGDIEGLDFKATPFLPEQINGYIVGGKSFPTSFRDRPFNDPDSNILFHFKGINFDLDVRYSLTFADKLAKLGDIGKYKYPMVDSSNKIKGKMMELNENSLVFRLDGGQFTHYGFVKGYIQESKDELEKIRNKILENSEELKDFLDQIQGGNDFKDIKKNYLETLTGSLDKKIAQLESLKKTGAAPNKIEKLEKEIYAITTLGLKLQNQYILDLLEEYTAKLNSIPSDTFKRLKEDGKLGSLEENLTNDLKNIKIQIIRKSDNVVIKTVNLVKDDKVKVLE